MDAAAELPPVANFERFIDAGADLVAFSGGKAIRGPQTTGILAGRADLVSSVAAQHLDMHAAEAVWEPPTELLNPEELGGVPRQGIGRPMKVGKEELAGLVRALEAFVDEDHDALRQEWRARSERIAEALDSITGVSTSVTAADKTSIAPELEVRIAADAADTTATDVVGGLRREEPRVFVGADDLPGAFTINPMCLTDEEAEYVGKRVQSYFDA